MYKWVTAASTYDAEEPWATLGRFGDGSWKTIYLAQSACGAMAEFFRRHPEFLDLEVDDLNISLYALTFSIEGQLLDMVDAAGQSAVHFPASRLTSSEPDEHVRYLECRQLAREAIVGPFTGIRYPSAAAEWAAWNAVLFGDPEPSRWVCCRREAVELQMLSRAEVRVLK